MTVLIIVGIVVILAVPLLVRMKVLSRPLAAAVVTALFVVAVIMVMREPDPAMAARSELAAVVDLFSSHDAPAAPEILEARAAGLITGLGDSLEETRVFAEGLSSDNEVLEARLALAADTLSVRKQYADSLLGALQRRLAEEKRQRMRAQEAYQQHLKLFEDELEKNLLTIRLLTDSITGLTTEVFALNGLVTFPVGAATLESEARDFLIKAGPTFHNWVDEDPGNVLHIIGHTDSLRIVAGQGPYDSNWELSLHRASSVVHFLEDDLGVPGSRLVATGRSFHQPPWEGERNELRRVDIFLTRAASVNTTTSAETD